MSKLGECLFSGQWQGYNFLHGPVGMEKETLKLTIMPERPATTHIAFSGCKYGIWSRMFGNTMSVRTGQRMTLRFGTKLLTFIPE